MLWRIRPSGLSIAFTSMFSGSVPKRGVSGSPTGFAVQAYPDLYNQATRFRRTMDWLPGVTVLFLVITALMSWDVVLTSETLRKAEAEVLALPNATINDNSCHVTRNGSEKFFAAKAGADATIAVRCQILVNLENAGTVSPDPSYAARIAAADMLLGPTSWLHPEGIIVRLAALPPPKEDAENVSQPGPDRMDSEALCGGEGTCDRVADMIDLGESVTNVFSNNILPMMFGLLGTLSGLMRTITVRVRESILSPRHYRLSWSLLPMGVVAGLTAGLIISPDAGSSIKGTVGTLSATALAFLAGYGVDLYFNALDTILRRIFPGSTTPTGTSK